MAYVCTLKGHENAITDLKFKVQQKGSTLFLASASRDQYIRLWTFSNEMPSNLDPRKKKNYTFCKIQEE